MLLILNDKDPGMQFLLVAKLVTSALTDLEHLCALRCVLNQYSGLNQFYFCNVSQHSFCMLNLGCLWILDYRIVSWLASYLAGESQLVLVWLLTQLIRCVEG